MFKPRNASVTLRCANCSLIWAKGAWVREGRSGPVTYSFGLCSHCRSRPFVPRARPESREVAKAAIP